MLEDLQPPKNKSHYCKVDVIHSELSPEDGKIFMEAIDTPGLWGARTLSTELRKRGLEIADTTISKHRNKGCACYRD